MKYLLGLALTLSLSANEIDRMESIIGDIEGLRAEYTQCLKSLNDKKSLIKKVEILEKEINNNIFEKQVKELKNTLKTKENTIINLKKTIVELKKNRKKEEKTLVIVKNVPSVCVEENTFPQLTMKESVKEKEVKFTPSTFRLIDDSTLYDSVAGLKVFTWEKNTSFTSNIMTKNWMKVTGYFTEKNWKSSQVELWIKKENIVKR